MTLTKKQMELIQKLKTARLTKDELQQAAAKAEHIFKRQTR